MAKYIEIIGGRQGVLREEEENFGTKRLMQRAGLSQKQLNCTAMFERKHLLPSTSVQKGRDD